MIPLALSHIVTALFIHALLILFFRVTSSHHFTQETSHIHYHKWQTEVFSILCYLCHLCHITPHITDMTHYITHIIGVHSIVTSNASHICLVKHLTYLTQKKASNATLLITLRYIALWRRTHVICVTLRHAPLSRDVTPRPERRHQAYLLRQHHFNFVLKKSTNWGQTNLKV